MRKSTKYWIAAVIVLLVVLLSFRFFLANKAGAPTSAEINIDPSTLPGIQMNSAPWQPEINNLSARLQDIGLRLLTSEGTAMHIHQHLDISVNGLLVPVPANIGIDETNQLISPVHTHDGTGTIHIESDVVQDFTLGQFFDIWGVRFTDSCLGGYCNGDGKVLMVFVNGKKLDANFGEFVLQPHQEIFVYYGDPKDLPSVPPNYAFAPDL